MLKRILFRTLKNNEFESNLLRKLFKRWYGVTVGMYSYGCFDQKRMPSGMTIGRYCSFAQTCVFFARDHGLSYLSTHPYLYNSALGFVKGDTITSTKFIVEDDVWVGHNVIVTSRVNRIGRGAVLAAGAVVTKDVPAYAIVAGNPARIIRFRFDEQTIKRIEDSRWWTMSKDDLADKSAINPELLYNPRKFYEEH